MKVNVPEKEVTVNVPEQEHDTIIVENKIPEVKQVAPVVNVNVEPTPVEVKNDVEVNIPEPKPKKTKIKRDSAGQITEMETE